MEVNLIQAVFASAAAAALLYAWRGWALRYPSLPQRRSGYSCDDSATRAYQAAGRLFEQRDARFVRSRSPKLLRRLRAERHAALKLYLYEMHREFLTVSRWARETAAANDKPDLAAQALKLACSFYPAYFLLRVQGALGLAMPLHLRPSMLLQRLEPLRQMHSAGAIAHATLRSGYRE